MGRYHLFVAPDVIDGDDARIRGDDYHHLVRVLRLKEGSPIDLIDGTGLRHEGRVEQISPRQARVTICRRVELPPSPLPRLILLAGLARGSRFDLVLQKCTELGVDEIVPWECGRSVARPSSPERKQDRWNEIVRQAARQSRRPKLPLVRPPVRYAEGLPGGRGDEGDLRLIACLDGTAQPLASMEQRLRRPPDQVWLAVGPEGGFDSAETAQAIDRGFAPVNLGPQVLRSETAAITLLAIVAHLTGRLASDEGISPQLPSQAGFEGGQ